jgi:MFS family permease
MIKQLRQVLYISFSAFFADLGYQAALSLFSIYLVYLLKAPVYLYGIAEALNYGLGSLFGYFGGRLSDHFGAKKVSIFGNALIPLMSLYVFTNKPLFVILFFSWGWWMRNLRTPARRALLSQVTSTEERQEAYGILHALDIAGATIAVGYITLSLFLKLDLKLVMLTTVAYLATSTLLLAFVKASEKPRPKHTKMGTKEKALFSGIIISTSLFGFSYFSFGYPILTVTQRFNAPYLGTLTYVVFLLVSSLSGYVFGRVKYKEALLLAMGYAVASFGSLGFQLSTSLPLYFASSALMGVSVGMVETFEPSLMSKIYLREGEGMGILSAFRSFGLFTGNLVMGFLYSFHLAYWYAFLVSLVAFLVMLASSQKS